LDDSKYSEGQLQTTRERTNQSLIEHDMHQGSIRKASEKIFKRVTTIHINNNPQHIYKKPEREKLTASQIIPKHTPASPPKWPRVL
jgi:hypothetical protein